MKTRPIAHSSDKDLPLETAHLSTSSSTAPAGWKLVPAEPTWEMIDAFFANTRARDESWKEAYRDMLAAAPQPPTTEQSSAVEQPRGEQEQEPVAWQCRMRPDWKSNKDCWYPWQDCTREQAAMYQQVPLLHDWAYESRQLYTHSQPRREPQFDAFSVDQERLAVQFCAEIAGPLGSKPSLPDPVRLLEMAEALYRAEVQEISASHQQPQREPLSESAIAALRVACRHQFNFVTMKEFSIITRAVERAHGITGEQQ